MRRVQKGWQFWYKLTCQLGQGHVTWRQYHVDMAALTPSACGELVSQTGLWCSQVFAGGVLLLAPTVALAAAITSPLRQLM